MYCIKLENRSYIVVDLNCLVVKWLSVKKYGFKLYVIKLKDTKNRCPTFLLLNIYPTTYNFTRKIFYRPLISNFEVFYPSNTLLRFNPVYQILLELSLWKLKLASFKVIILLASENRPD